MMSTIIVIPSKRTKNNLKNKGFLFRVCLDNKEIFNTDFMSKQAFFSLVKKVEDDEFLF